MTDPTTTIHVPASKSVTHRMFICAALAHGTSRIAAPLMSDDTKRTQTCLTSLGADFQDDDNGFRITGIKRNGPNQAPLTTSLDVAESGTTCRLITAVAAAFSGEHRIFGKGRMHDRPISGLTQALEPLGIQCHFEQKPDCPPLILRSQGLFGGQTSVSLEESSQYLSGLLLAAPLALGPIRVTITGKKAVSFPYVAVTLAVMADFGVMPQVEILQNEKFRPAQAGELTDIIPGQVRFSISPTVYRPNNRNVEGDWSNASYFLAASALLPSPLAVGGLNLNSAQGDRAILDILRRMGADIREQGDTILVSSKHLCGIDVDMGRCPDLVPTVAVLAAHGQGNTRIRNVAHLKIKESDRLSAVATELSRAGCRVETHSDGLTIVPGPLSKSPRTFNTYGDHRMAMSLSLLELSGVPVELDNPGCVAKSFPDFFVEWDKVRLAAKTMGINSDGRMP